MEAKIQVKDPVCGMTFEPDRAKCSHVHDNATFYFCCDSCLEKFVANPIQFIAEKDPVCGMEVDPNLALMKYQHEGKAYYFCSSGCQKKFSANPAKYLSSQKLPDIIEDVDSDEQEYICPMCPVVSNIGPGTCPICGMALEPASPELSIQRNEYVCPMHPEIIQSEPGACPKCGMALEARAVDVEEEDNPELRGMRRRFWISAALTLPVFLLAMTEMLFGQPLAFYVEPRTQGWMALLSTGLDVSCYTKPKHVYPRRIGNRCGLCLQCRRLPRTGSISTILS